MNTATKETAYVVSPGGRVVFDVKFAVHGPSLREALVGAEIRVVMRDLAFQTRETLHETKRRQRRGILLEKEKLEGDQNLELCAILASLKTANALCSARPAILDTVFVRARQSLAVKISGRGEEAK